MLHRNRGVRRHEIVNPATLTENVRASFLDESAAVPHMTLRGGNALDEYKPAPPFDASQDFASAEYLERYAWGVGYLDAASWRHYLPQLVAHAIEHVSEGSNSVDALLNSLRPPDREPPRLASLSKAQEIAIAEFLDYMAFSGGSVHQELACLALEEWWAPGALFRAGTE